MRKGRRRVKREGKLFNWKLLLSSVLFLGSISLLIFSFFTLFNIKTTDPIEENIPGYGILSKSEDALESTIFIFEREKDEKRRIADVYVFLKNREKAVSLLIYLPGSLHFNGLEENFGNSVAISSLRYAGDFLQEGRGIEYALWQLSEILGFKVDKYIWVTTEAYEVFSEVYGDMNEVKERYRDMYKKENGTTLSESFFRLHSLSSQFSSLKTLLNAKVVSMMDGNIYSNISFVNVLREIDTFESSVRSSETNALDISLSLYSTEELAEGGGQVRNINISEYDKALREYLSGMVDKELEKERVRVEVYNASGQAGRAGVYARKVLNNGLDVVRFGNAPKNLEKSVVYVSNAQDIPNSLDIVSEILLGRFEEVAERPSFMTTGDIVILLGEDISQIEIF